MNSTEKKIIKLGELTQKNEDKVVLCHGHFNVIHPGHIRYLDYARQQGARLVVSVVGDATLLNSESSHHFNENERAAGIASIQTVDHVIILSQSKLEDIIRDLKPNVLVLGKEFENEQHNQVYEAIQLLHKQGGTVLYHAGEAHYASSDLLRDSLPDLHEQKIQQYKQACIQQNLHLNELLDCLDKFKDTSLMVIGDTIVDQYVACEALGMSAEAPIVVVRELDSREYAGGASIVAMHASALGAQCRYISVVGHDSNANFISQELEKLDVEHSLIEDNARPTTFKIRYMVNNQKMFRVSRMIEHSIPRTVEEKIIREIRTGVSNVRGILISDFVYGVITPRILKTITEIAKKHNLLVFGDLQCSSQVGNVSKFKNFDLLCPTEKESRIALEAQEEGLEWVAINLMKKSNAGNLVMKLGGDGFISYESGGKDFINRQYFPALNTNPVDVAGAGDSLLAALSVGLSSGATLMQSSAIGAGMSSLAVQNIGNIPVSYNQLKKYLEKI